MSFFAALNWAQRPVLGALIGLTYVDASRSAEAKVFAQRRAFVVGAVDAAFL